MVPEGLGGGLETHGGEKYEAGIGVLLNTAHDFGFSLKLMSYHEFPDFQDMLESSAQSRFPIGSIHGRPYVGTLCYSSSCYRPNHKIIFVAAL